MSMSNGYDDTMEYTEGEDELDVSEMSQEAIKSDLEIIKVKIEVLEEDIKKGEALERIKKTDDYKLVFEGEYLEAEANRLFEILTKSKSRREQMENVKDRLEAIRYFNLFVGFPGELGQVINNARTAKGYLSEERELERKLLSALDEE